MPGNAAEKQRIARLESHLRAYLAQAYPCEVSRVEAGLEQIHVSGKVGAEKGELRLAEVPLVAHVTEGGFAELRRRSTSRRMAPSPPCCRASRSAAAARSTASFRAGRSFAKTAGAPELLSHARGADAVEGARPRPETLAARAQGARRFSRERPGQRSR